MFNGVLTEMEVESDTTMEEFIESLQEHFSLKTRPTLFIENVTTTNVTKLSDIGDSVVYMEISEYDSLVFLDHEGPGDFNPDKLVYAENLVGAIAELCGKHGIYVSKTTCVQIYDTSDYVRFNGTTTFEKCTERDVVKLAANIVSIVDRVCNLTSEQLFTVIAENVPEADCRRLHHSGRASLGRRVRAV